MTFMFEFLFTTQISLASFIILLFSTNLCVFVIGVTVGLDRKSFK